MLENEPDKLQNDIEKLKSNTVEVFTILEKIAIYQKKVVEMAKILGVVAMHLETKPKQPISKLYVKVDVLPLTGTKSINWERYTEVTTDEKVYRSWLEQ